MNPEFPEALFFDERDEITFAELVELSGLPELTLLELIDYGALSPVDPEVSAWRFSGRSVVLARTAGRLSHDFELDARALSVLLSLMDRIEALENELRALRARFSR